MTMDDFQFMDSFKRKRIKLTLKTATFLGIVQRINTNKTVILEDVVDVKNGRKFPGVKLFFGHEILNVEFPNVTKTDRDNTSDHRPEGHLTVAEFQPYRKGLILNDDDESHVNFVVIDEFHEKFGPAMMHIRKQQVIGIGADGVGTFQHERLCWLQIATKNKVYLFDILLLGARAFKNGLSMILENNHILKVTHDCRSLAGCLMAQFGVNLTNVFDTQVADILCFYTATGGFLPDRVSTLPKVVSLHLKMSSSQLSSLNIKSLLTKEDKEVWYVRPCPLSLLKVMALSVIHLQPLRLVLLDALMADYTGLVDSYLSGSREEPVHMQNIGSSSVLELPRELRELEHTRQKRQKWAVDRYPVTEQGLLERSNPRPLPPSQNGQGQDTATQKQPDPPVPTEVVPVVPAPGQGPAEKPRPSSTLGASDPDAMTSALTQEAQQSYRKQPSGVVSPVAPSGATGLLEIVMDTMAGRGRSLLKDPTPPILPVFPSLGRGLALPIPAAQVPKESPGALKTQAPVGRLEVPVPPGPIPSPVQPSENIPGAGRGLIQKPQGLTSPLSLSFSSFRKR
ncbi:piRNA biogenesis protein EXD1 isoform X1 [Salvelinus sp. IW2-2015]|uniref:piRNA biogenesis protein EXD1 isoform X1 n=1 Tax=Salvelinus sp. IW2-2015 TaxID=2691554 RepID=UPI000CDF6511|nr:piRNA biogenesis protein EXD1 isoform X1 [Salvelinus alpinus]